jgi:cGMP-specific 3',5'-cyclic phosphodiesterase, invertebrate
LPTAHITSHRIASTGIQNAQLFESSVLEYKRNQILLNLARSIFEEQNNLECLVTKIMKEARDLLKCERCAVFLVDLECCEAVKAIKSNSLSLSPQLSIISSASLSHSEPLGANGSVDDESNRLR